MKYRHLNRSSAHRQSLLRNLVTSLIAEESITTTWHKAKEAQRLAEKLITLAKKDTNASRTRAEQILFTPLDHMPRLFTTLRERYLTRPGGYTRVLRTEPRNRNNDQAPTAILELVDGPRDMRFAMTARTVARERELEHGIRDVTLFNIKKVTQFRQGGERALMAMADSFAEKRKEGMEGAQQASQDDEEDDHDDEEEEEEDDEEDDEDEEEGDGIEVDSKRKSNGKTRPTRTGLSPSTRNEDGRRQRTGKEGKGRGRGKETPKGRLNSPLR